MNAVALMQHACLPTTAGVSGTTKDFIHLMLLLGDPTPIDLANFRSAMVVWMTINRDHSLTEIMLGAEPFMAQEHRAFEDNDEELRVRKPKHVLPGDSDNSWNWLGAHALFKTEAGNADESHIGEMGLDRIFENEKKEEESKEASAEV